MKILVLVLSLLSCSEYQAPNKKVENIKRAKVVNNRPEDDAENLKKIHLMFEHYQSEFKSVKNIVPKEAIAIKEAIYVDVREEKERKVSQIKNAITKKVLLENLDDYKDKKIISYCTIGYRSGRFTKKLMDKGLKAYNLRGGLLLWSHANYQVYLNDKVTNRIHVYDSPWDLVKSGYVSVY